MEKPKMKREIGIVGYSEKHRLIFFDATLDAAQDLNEFGWLTRPLQYSSYHLFVDARFDFFEVLKYIQNYGSVV